MLLFSLMIVACACLLLNRQVSNGNRSNGSKGVRKIIPARPYRQSDWR